MPPTMAPKTNTGKEIGADTRTLGVAPFAPTVQKIDMVAVPLAMATAIEATAPPFTAPIITSVTVSICSS